jgi:hypothetical protein
MRWGIAIPIALALAGCGHEPQPRENQASASEKLAAAENVTVNSASPAGTANQSGILPPANAALRFVGTWARSAANCASSPWRFTKDELSASGGPRCSFYDVKKVPGGYDVAAQCPTKEPVHTDLIKLRFAESARAMLVESNAIKPMGLVYCGK